MEPRQHEVVSNVEQAPVQPGVGERVAQGYELSTDSHAEKAPEVGQVQAEISQLAMPSLPMPVIAAPTAAQGQVSNATPLAASDDDLIEKEWVDKAKSIIAATKDDPYRREQEINTLQIEYIRKRYGRTIGDAGN